MAVVVPWFFPVLVPCVAAAFSTAAPVSSTTHPTGKKFFATTTQSQPGKKKKKKKRSDANIQARVKIDMECQIRKAQQAEAFKVNGQAKWAEGWNRKNNLKGATTEGIKARQEEIQMANRELVILRKARMQKLYEEDLKGYVYGLVVYHVRCSRSIFLWC